ncbi:MAG: hypothetical protein E7C63_08450, partial [Finegoldia magna]|uniref:hypothetical protein n=1 Tax=Finegoldia magna TaxID=1260 RepID=UPI002902D367
NAGLPVFAVTDTATDIGDDIINGNFGWWCQSDDPLRFSELLNQIILKDLLEYSENSYEYLEINFNIKKHYYKILNLFE